MIRKMLMVFFIGLAVLCGFFFYAQYFKWRSCFNEMGRCFDAQTGVVYHAQSGPVWLVMALAALGAALLVWRVLR